MQLLSDLSAQEQLLAAAAIDAMLNAEQRDQVMQICEMRHQVKPDGSCSPIGFVWAARRVLDNPRAPFS